MVRQKARKSVDALVNEQVQQWLVSLSQQDIEQKSSPYYPCVAISRQRGSGGWKIGKLFAEKMGFKLFDSEIINEIAKNQRISKKVLKTVDEQVLSNMELFINRIFRNKYIEPNEFQQLLVKTVLSIAQHGHGVFIGRGAHAIIPPEKCLRVRCVAPLGHRIENVMRQLKLNKDEATFDVMTRDRDREIFVKQNFGLNIDDQARFDIILNTWRFPCPAAVEFLISVYCEMFNLTCPSMISKVQRGKK